jgi:hypothetical protein
VSEEQVYVQGADGVVGFGLCHGVASLQR